MSFYQGEYRYVSQLNQSMFGPECITANCAKNCCATKPLPAGCPERVKKENYIPLSYWPVIDVASGGRLTHCAKSNTMYPFNQMIFIKK